MTDFVKYLKSERKLQNLQIFLHFIEFSFGFGEDNYNGFT